MDDLEFGRAAKLFKRALETLKPSEMGRSPELDTRESLELALYQSGDLDAAAFQYNALKERFANFQFATGRVTPETIETLQTRAMAAATTHRGTWRCRWQ